MESSGAPSPTTTKPDLTLTPGTYAVYVKVPGEWWNEAEAIIAIAEALHDTRTAVRKRLMWLINAKLVERRTSHGIAAATEIRRIGK